MALLTEEIAGVAEEDQRGASGGGVLEVVRESVHQLERLLPSPSKTALVGLW